MQNKIIERLFKSDNYNEYFYTIDLNSIESEDDILTIYSNLYDRLITKDIKSISERIIGIGTLKQSFVDIRNRYLKPDLNICSPFSYIECIPANGFSASSIHIYGIEVLNDKVDIQYLKNKENHVIGCNFKGGEKEFIYLTGLYTPDISGESPGEKYFKVFNEIESVFYVNGYELNDIVRTWFYIKDIYKNYPSFNQARKDFFDKHKIGYDKDAPYLPASTCVEGYFATDAFISANIYGIKKGSSKTSFHRVVNSMQNEAEGMNYKFQPTFSRGIVIKEDKFNQLQISGTASIDKNGKTIYASDPYNQIKYTLHNIENILKSYGFSFSDIIQSTCFYFDKSFHTIYLKVIEELGLTNISYSHMVSNICREDLLFEFDGIAIRKSD